MESSQHSNQHEGRDMEITQKRYREVIEHLGKARQLMTGLLCSVDGKEDQVCLDGCFEGLIMECQDVATFKLGIVSSTESPECPIYSQNPT